MSKEDSHSHEESSDGEAKMRKKRTKVESKMERKAVGGERITHFLR